VLGGGEDCSLGFLQAAVFWRNGAGLHAARASPHSLQVVAVEARKHAREQEVARGQLRHNPFAPIRATVDEFRAASPSWIVERAVAEVRKFAGRLMPLQALIQSYPALLTPRNRLPPRPVCELEPCVIDEALMRAACEPRDPFEAAQLEQLISLCADMHAFVSMFLYAFCVQPGMFAVASNNIMHFLEEEGGEVDHSWEQLHMAVLQELDRQQAQAAAQQQAAESNVAAAGGGGGAALRIPPPPPTTKPSCRSLAPPVRVLSGVRG
jgi:hypothetical protein